MLNESSYDLKLPAEKSRPIVSNLKYTILAGDFGLEIYDAHGNLVMAIPINYFRAGIEYYSMFSSHNITFKDGVSKIKLLMSDFALKRLQDWVEENLDKVILDPIEIDSEKSPLDQIQHDERNAKPDRIEPEERKTKPDQIKRKETRTPEQIRSELRDSSPDQIEREVRRVERKSKLKEIAFVVAVISFGYIFLDNYIDRDSVIRGDDEIALQQKFNPMLVKYSNLIMGDSTNVVESNIPRIRGKIAFIDGDTGKLDDRHFSSYPKGLRATFPSEVRTLVVIHRQLIHLFDYEGGLVRPDGTSTDNIPVYRIDWYVKIIDITKQSVVATKTLFGIGREVYPGKAFVFNFSRNRGMEYLVMEEEGSRKRTQFVILKDKKDIPFGITASDPDIFRDFENYIIDMWKRV